MRRWVGLFVGAVFFAGAAAGAATAFDQGAKLYKQGNYKQACAFFEQAVAANPNDANALYCDALCWHQLRQWRRAAQRYSEVVQRFPDSAAAKQASAALKSFDKSYLGAAGTTSGGSSDDQAGSDLSSKLQAMIGRGRAMLGDNLDTSNCPQQSRIYYTDMPNTSGIAFIVDAQINGRPLKMLFDTGASTMLIGKNHLSQLGLPAIPANTPPVGRSQGVGGQDQPIWVQNYDVKVGQMELKNCPVLIQENCDMPLLGQTFFKHFSYTIDYGSHSILLTNKNGGAGGGRATATNYDIPFTRDGNEMLVTAQVNGKSYPFYFDTGAMSIALSMADAQRLGLHIPDDARQGYSRGVSGLTRSWNFPVSYIKCGPIEKRDVEVSVLEETAMGHPLLGQPFYAGWQYTIDNANSMIHLVRR